MWNYADKIVNNSMRETGSLLPTGKGPKTEETRKFCK